jgi:hypothetical protein
VVLVQNEIVCSDVIINFLALRWFVRASLAVEGSAAGPNFRIEQKSAKVTNGNVLRTSKIFIAMPEEIAG